MKRKIKSFRIAVTTTTGTKYIAIKDEVFKIVDLESSISFSKMKEAKEILGKVIKCIDKNVCMEKKKTIIGVKVEKMIELV